MADEGVDRWIQRVLVAALVALACVLMGMGVALYAPARGAQPAKMVAR